jgi:hypothetical protein
MTDLIGTVRAAELLDGFVGGPRQLQGDVQPPPPVLCAPVRLVWERPLINSSIYLSIYLRSIHLTIYVSMYLCIYLSICL